MTNAIYDGKLLRKYINPEKVTGFGVKLDTLSTFIDVRLPLFSGGYYISSRIFSQNAGLIVQKAALLLSAELLFIEIDSKSKDISNYIYPYNKLIIYKCNEVC